MLISVAVLTFSSLVYFAEKEEQNWSYVDSFWWGLLTITTVGYGKCHNGFQIISVVLNRRCAFFCQFHQRFTRAFFIQIFWQCQNITKKRCRNNICTKNSYVKCWWNWHKVSKIWIYLNVIDVYKVSKFRIVISSYLFYSYMSLEEKYILPCCKLV